MSCENDSLTSSNLIFNQNSGKVYTKINFLHKSFEGADEFTIVFKLFMSNMACLKICNDAASNIAELPIFVSNHLYTSTILDDTNDNLEDDHPGTRYQKVQ